MKNFKIGVFGAGRGYDIAKNFKFLNCEIVALCDNRKDRMDATLQKLNDKSIKTYDDFDEFLEVEKIPLDKPNIIYYNIKRTVQNRNILGS